MNGSMLLISRNEKVIITYNLILELQGRNHEEICIVKFWGAKII